MIELKNVIKRYGNTIAVDNLSLKINKGEIFALLGPNGAGKSTINKMIIGLLKASSGEILVNGLNINKQGLKAREYLALVPQELALYESMSAIDNVLFFAKLAGLRGKQLRDKTDKALSFCGLEDTKTKKVSTFSGGMKRRLNIACAIVHEPQIIIMDEPTVGIDPQSRTHILDSIKQLNNKDMTVIYTSHYMSEVERICDRVGIIDNGKLIAVGTTNELKSQLKEQEKIIIDILDLNYTALNEIKQLYGVNDAYYNNYRLEINTTISKNTTLEALTILAKHNMQIQKIEIEKPSLEDVYLSLTGKSLRD
ncbi:ABC transporter ATP-binding protein [Clostridium sp. 'deep sea']|uniref:ABC transporter ATP-binding protein n=1 Tax=Clostridium sp. 'deep sea' TaxID=2779445 RepID=UPI001FABF48D|nr:ABC transporter ATP-binding protein [Clostridium sp. 'deep sea']